MEKNYIDEANKRELMRLRKSLTPTPTGFFSNYLSDEHYHAQRHDETILRLDEIGFLFQQSSTGWNPGRPGLRSMGYRTAEEIEEERKLLQERRSLANADKRKLQ